MHQHGGVIAGDGGGDGGQDKNRRDKRQDDARGEARQEVSNVSSGASVVDPVVVVVQGAVLFHSILFYAVGPIWDGADDGDQREWLVGTKWVLGLLGREDFE